jgi:predicted nucleic acid-binding protein
MFPTVMRDLLLGVAKTGYFNPVWSDRLLEEWRRAAARLGDEQAGVAGVEIALLRANWRDATVSEDTALEDTLWLPDPNDAHVLASCITGQADAVITANTKDFPLRILSEYNVLRRHPDEFLLEYAHNNQEIMVDLVAQNQTQVETLLGHAVERRKLLKRAGLPRLGKYLD